MTRKPASVLRAVVVLAALLAVALVSAGGAFALEADDTIPGIPVTASPIGAHLDSVSDPDDVRSIWLEAGDTLYMTLDRTGTFTAGFWPNLYLYAPGTTAIHVFSPIQHAEGVIMPKTITYVAPWTGLYYINMYAPDTGAPESGDVVLAWSTLRPVFRFYNPGRNTHFYTPSVAERAYVNARWSNVFVDEGPVYYLNPYNNTAPLYRFYNQVTSSHFYTASPQERAYVNAKWPRVFIDEGPTYSVNQGPVPNSIPVFRFYNRRNGSHFYTASAGERDYVNAHWPSVYADEGVAFYIGQ